MRNSTVYKKKIPKYPLPETTNLFLLLGVFWLFYSLQNIE